jgi:hypothetical protein
VRKNFSECLGFQREQKILIDPCHYTPCGGIQVADTPAFGYKPLFKMAIDFKRAFVKFVPVISSITKIRA